MASSGCTTTIRPIPSAAAWPTKPSASAAIPASQRGRRARRSRKPGAARLLLGRLGRLGLLEDRAQREQQGGGERERYVHLVRRARDPVLEALVAAPVALARARWPSPASRCPRRNGACPRASRAWRAAAPRSAPAAAAASPPTPSTTFPFSTAIVDEPEGHEHRQDHGADPRVGRERQEAQQQQPADQRGHDDRVDRAPPLLGPVDVLEVQPERVLVERQPGADAEPAGEQLEPGAGRLQRQPEAGQPASARCRTPGGARAARPPRRRSPATTAPSGCASAGRSCG